MQEQLDFRLAGGGASPTPSLQIKAFRVHPVSWASLVPILEGFHYRRGWIGGSIKVCLGLYSPTELIGGAVFGDAWHGNTYAEPGRVVTELRRLVLVDAAPKNSESYFIGKAAWWLKKNTPYNRILSYSDISQGHQGTIYKASGFKYMGQTGGGSKVVFEGRTFHARSLTIERDYAKRLAEAVGAGTAQKVKTGVKNIWIKDI